MVKNDRFMHKFRLQAVKTLNVILMTASFAACWFLYYVSLTTRGNRTFTSAAVLLLFVLIYANTAQVYDALKVSLFRISDMIYSQTLAFLITDGIMYITICIMTGGLENLLPVLACIAGQAVVSVLWSKQAHKWYFATFGSQKTIVIYDERDGVDELITTYGMQKKFNVLRTVEAAEAVSDLNILNGYETVFLSGVQSHVRNKLLKYCVQQGINVYVTPSIGDVIMSSAKRMHLFHLPILRVEQHNPAVFYVYAKRLFDLVLSLAALVITSPIFLITAIAVKSDGGPAFYKQERLTQNGRTFFVLKFRSMRIDAEKDGVARLSAGENDPRITKVGRFIRAVRLDELPQLINILKGEMSIVGPRPERPSIAADYEKELPEFRLRLQVKAGLTGYAQVYGKYNTPPRDKLLLDLMYIANPSIMEDLRIMLATVKILFSKESTEGVEAGNTTAMK